MTEYLDLESWTRKDLFHFFRGFDNPFFSATIQAEVTALLELTRAREDLSYLAAIHYCSLRAANATPEFRYRLRGDRVAVHDVVHGGTTILVEDSRFVFTYFDYTEDYSSFQAGMRHAVDRAKSGALPLDPAPERDDLIYHTSIPWISFTGLSHSHSSSEDSVPQVAFGRYVNEGGRVRMPVSVDTNHALVDGLHMGRFLQELQSLLESPDSWL